MRQLTRFAWMLTVLGMVVAGGRNAPAAITSDRPAAIVIFPYLTRHLSQGFDTAIRLSNTDRTAAADVTCFLEDTTPGCLLDPAQPCLDDADCASGDTCKAPRLEVAQFTLHLSPHQPISWPLSAGLATLPVPGGGGPIPPAPVDPFRGVLRCIVVDANGAPTDRNVLQGEAVLEHYDAAAAILDAAAYNAIGVAARPGAGVDDGRLVLGGPDAEYEACPAQLTLNHFLDLGIDPVTQASASRTQLAIVTCGADLSSQTPISTGNVVQYFVFNEFEQRFSTSRSFEDQFVSVLSDIDVPIPDRSIFSAGIAGTLGGRTVITTPGGGGIMAVAVEGHVDLSDSARVSTAAFNVHTEGEQAEPDVMTLPTQSVPFGCSARPLDGCKTAGANRLMISERRSRPGKRLVWEWRKGEATTMTDLGDPRRDTDYALCIYAGAGAAVQLSIPASNAWAAVRRGFKYADPASTADGVFRIALQASTRATAHALLRARGDGIPSMGLDAPLATPVVVQLVNSTGSCSEGVFDSQHVLRNKQGVFEARASTP